MSLKKNEKYATEMEAITQSRPTMYERRRERKCKLKEDSRKKGESTVVQVAFKKTIKDRPHMIMTNIRRHEKVTHTTTN